MNKLSIKDLDIKGKKVLMRVDYNVPLRDGIVGDNKRIAASLPSVEFILNAGGRLILMSHLGRPDGRVKSEFSMKPVAAELGKLIHKDVGFASDCIGKEALQKAEALADGEVLLLENLRFHSEEEDNDDSFATELAKLGDIYVNDAFGTAHRAHASTAGVTKHFAQAACGFLMKKELDYLGQAILNPSRPFVAIMGGAKVKDKIPVLENMLPKADKVVIGGGMVYTFYKAMGIAIGNSLLDEESLPFVSELLKKYADKIILPEDILVTNKLDFKNLELGDLKVISAKEGIEDGWMGVDCGPLTLKSLHPVLTTAKTIIWNGPMGVFEIPASAKGTFGVAEMLAEATASGATTIIGGGDSASAVKKAKLVDKMSHVSTGGGASLEFIEGKALPGVDALSNA